MINFKQIGQNEFKFSFAKTKFILAEKSVGVYGLGTCVSLYQLNGFKKEFLKCIGWTKSDNHGGPSKEVLLEGIVTMEECKQGAKYYVMSLLN
jgi:hypothetical protein